MGNYVLLSYDVLAIKGWPALLTYFPEYSSSHFFKQILSHPVNNINAHLPPD